MFCAQPSPAEQPVLLSHWDDAQGALEVLRVDRYLRIIQVNRQANPPLPDISQRAQEGTARQESLSVKLLVDPRVEALKHRFRLLLAACELGLPIQAIVADLLLDLVQNGDRIQCLFGLRRLDILGIKEFTACVGPTLRVRDPCLLRVMRIGAVAIALQYGTLRPLQAKRGLDMLRRPAGIAQDTFWD